MRRVGLISFVLAFVLVLVSSARAQTGPSAVSAWVAIPAAGATWTSAYVELKNPSMYDVYVVSAASDAAAGVEFRAAAVGAAEPAVVPEFAVPAYGGVAAAATAPHLRLIGLTRALAAGDTVALTLKTDTGDTLKVAAAVRTP